MCFFPPTPLPQKRKVFTKIVLFQLSYNFVKLRKRRVVDIRYPFGDQYPPGKDYISHQTGKGKSSTQKCLWTRYVCSLEGKANDFERL